MYSGDLQPVNLNFNFIYLLTTVTKHITTEITHCIFESHNDDGFELIMYL